MIAFAVERGIELVMEGLSRLPALVGGQHRGSRLENRVVAQVLGFSAGMVLSETFHLDLLDLVASGMVTDADWILNGLLVAWTADIAHQVMRRWVVAPAA